MKHWSDTEPYKDGWMNQWMNERNIVCMYFIEISQTNKQTTSSTLLPNTNIYSEWSLNHHYIRLFSKIRKKMNHQMDVWRVWNTLQEKKFKTKKSCCILFLLSPIIMKITKIIEFYLLARKNNDPSKLILVWNSKNKQKIVVKRYKTH